MIEFTKSYKTADGQVFGSLEEAQVHDLALLLPGGPADTESIARELLKQKSAVVDILTTTVTSKPKARATHGGTKNRKKTVITDAATSVGSTSNT